MSRVAVIGAGVAGLVAARRLTADGHAVDVYERWPGLGGQAATFDAGDGVLLERYYHHWFTSDRHIVALWEELGLGEIEWRPSSMALFADGRSRPFTTPLDLLRFRPVSLRDRVRMGLAVLQLQRSGADPSAFDHQRARDWIVREMGRGPWEKVWGPLLRAKFGARADDVPLAWLRARLTTRRTLAGRQAWRESLGYPRDSFEPLFGALRDAVERNGGRVLIDRPVARLSADLRITPGAGGSFRRGLDPRAFPTAEPTAPYDAVLATVPNDVFLALLADDARAALAPGYADRLAQIEYATALCLVLEVDRRVTDFYWTNVADDEMPFLGLIEHTNFVEPERYGGRRFLYVANYVERDDPLLALDADALVEHCLPGLRKINPAFAPSWIRARWLFREPAGQPIVGLGYRDRIAPARTGIPGLVLANTTQIYPEDRGTNYAVALGEDAAAHVRAQLSPPVAS